MNTDKSINEAKGNAALPLVIGRCSNCKYWERIKDGTYSKDMGKCSLLSGRWIKDGKEIMGRKYSEEEYPDTEKTGIESYPICVHDGAGFTYTTKSWFGCVGYNAL